MSQFVVICMFKEFMNEGWSTHVARRMTIIRTGMKTKAVRQIIKNSDECQELINQRIKASNQLMRFPTGENITWN